MLTSLNSQTVRQYDVVVYYGQVKYRYGYGSQVVGLRDRARGYSYSYGLMGLSKSICQQLPLLVRHLRPPGAHVGWREVALGTGASILHIVTRVLGGV